MGPTTRAVGGAALLALVAGALFSQDLGRYPLLDPDEARHAEVAREMADGHGLGRLFLPTLDLEPYREKPAGYYWLVALAYAALGVGEAAARAVSALAALVAVLSRCCSSPGRSCSRRSYSDRGRGSRSWAWCAAHSPSWRSGRSSTCRWVSSTR